MNIYRNFDANTICTEMIFTVAWLFIYIKTKIHIIIEMNIGHYKKVVLQYNDLSKRLFV